MTGMCKKCKQEFNWEEEDALIKLQYGTKFIVPCPHCDKLNIVYVNKDAHSND